MLIDLNKEAVDALLRGGRVTVPIYGIEEGLREIVMWMEPKRIHWCPFCAGESGAA